MTFIACAFDAECPRQRLETDVAFGEVSLNYLAVQTTELSIRICRERLCIRTSRPGRPPAPGWLPGKEGLFITAPWGRKGSAAAPSMGPRQPRMDLGRLATPKRRNLSAASAPHPQGMAGSTRASPVKRRCRLFTSPPFWQLLTEPLSRLVALFSNRRTDPGNSRRLGPV